MRQLAEFKRYRAHLCAGLAHSDSDDEMLRRVAQWVVPSMDCGDGGWWIVDDTGFPQAGHPLRGCGAPVLRQAGQAGQLPGRRVSVSLACQGGSLPVAWRLYLRKDWSEDEARRDKAGVPKDVGFGTKTAIALAQIEHLFGQGAPRRWLGGSATRTAGVDEGPGQDAACRTVAEPRVERRQRTQRHVPSSITCLRLRTAAALLRNLPRCPR